MNFGFKTKAGAHQATFRLARALRSAKSEIEQIKADPSCPLPIKRAVAAYAWQAEQKIVLPFLAQLQKLYPLKDTFK